MSITTYERILEEAQQLTQEERVRLQKELGMPALTEPRQPHRSSYGALKDLGPAPSAGDIDEVRKEAWASLAKDDTQDTITAAQRSAATDVFLAELNALAREIGAAWHGGGTAVDAVREGRREL